MMPGSILRVRLTPRAGRTEIIRWDGGVLYLRVSAPPVDGAANSALIAFLSEVLGVRKSAIIIKSGASSREKKLEIEEIDPDVLTLKIERAVAQGSKR
jgi:uncharacterized protein (TIGR00251 family)